MSSKWDSTGIAFQSKTWAALSEHLLPGAFIFVFGSSRGWHRLAVAIEDAGFIFHPSLMVWGALQGQGFPKSTRIDTQIDRAAGAERKVVGTWKPQGTARPAKGSKGHHGKMTTGAMAPIDYDNVELDITAPATDLARAWEGHRYGRQALKPAVEMIICAQKPYEGKPVECIVETGAGALFIDGGRVGTSKDVPASVSKTKTNGIWGKFEKGGIEDGDGFNPNMGRWPPNFCLVHVPPHICADCDGDGCEACNDTGLVGGCQRAGTKRVKGNGAYPAQSSPNAIYSPMGGHGDGVRQEMADPDGKETVAAYVCSESCATRRIGEQSGTSKGSDRTRHNNAGCQGYHGNPNDFDTGGYKDKGTAARFFPQFDWAAEVAERLANSDQVRYCSKASRSERDAGLDQMETKTPHAAYGDFKGTPEHATNMNGKQRCVHPCVKPIALCRWLATLLLPPPEYAPRRILVPFAGVASEMIGAGLAGWEEVIGIERETEYCTIGEARLKFWSQFPSYEAAMEAARNIQQSHRKQDAQAQSGQLKLTL